MKITPETIQVQISACQHALDGLNRSVREHKWKRLGDRNKKLLSEMDQLRQLLEGVSDLDEGMVTRLRQLNLNFRRSQRQLSSQSGQLETDIESLEKGMRKVGMIKGALEEG